MVSAAFRKSYDILAATVTSEYTKNSVDRMEVKCCNGRGLMAWMLSLIGQIQGTVRGVGGGRC